MLNSRGFRRSSFIIIKPLIRNYRDQCTLTNPYDQLLISLVCFTLNFSVWWLVGDSRSRDRRANVVSAYFGPQ